MVIEVNEEYFSEYMEGLGYVKVVRCQNCKYWMAIINDARNGACTERETLQITPANGYCHRAERKDEYVTLHHEDIHFIDDGAERAFYESLEERKEE